MSFENYFPIWDKLNNQQQERIRSAVISKSVKKGAIIHSGATDCSGLILLKTGQLRAFIVSEEGHEVTLFRLLDLDICLLSASCMFNSISFDVTVEAEKDTEFYLIPTEAYRSVMAESAALSNYTNELMAARFSEVMWLIEQIMWKSLDKRVATFLLEESALEDSEMLTITHESIANHIGTHREVVTRMLRYMQNEKMVSLSRGQVTIINKELLEKLRNS